MEYMFLLSKIAWKRMENEVSIPRYFREGITKLMLPYKIDMDLFETNIDCFNTRSSQSCKTGKSCTNSLVNILNERFNLPLGYPNWFYAAFPDVASWLITDEGMSYLKNSFSDSDDIVDSESDKVKIDILRQLVEVYKSKKCTKLELSD